MANMMQEFVKQELDSQIKNNYPHLRYPHCIYAKVVNVMADSDVYICTLKLLDKNKQVDTRFPEIPMIRTKIAVKKGDVIIVTFLYGECNPYVLGRCD